ncbi:hypothetical protein ABTY98_14050 [Streptomyces sp. NPDC096040]|uniref:hypothetical protein n=1 Tax=Streptomyces sp. NPDC096040 TaxID=3155541 RepID=UPI003327F30A
MFYKRLTELRSGLEHEDGPLTVDGRIALEYGLRGPRWNRERARWAAEQLG